MADTRTYTAVTSEVMDAIRAGLEAAAIDMPDTPDGEVTFFGTLRFKFGYTWDDQAETLELEILDKPFFAPADKLWEYADAGVSACGGTPPA